MWGESNPVKHTTCMSLHDAARRNTNPGECWGVSAHDGSGRASKLRLEDALPEAPIQSFGGGVGHMQPPSFGHGEVDLGGGGGKIPRRRQREQTSVALKRAFHGSKVKMRSSTSSGSSTIPRD
jgi:hypothetical protein